MSEIKLRAGDAAPATILEALAPHGTGSKKTFGKTADKGGAKPFQDVLGAVAGTARRGAGTHPPAIDRSGRALPTSAAHGRHATCVDDPEAVDDKKADTPDAAAPEPAPRSSALPANLDPLRALMLAVEQRHAAGHGVADERSRDGQSQLRTARAAGARDESDPGSAGGEVARHGAHKGAPADSFPAIDRTGAAAPHAPDVMRIPTNPITQDAFTTDQATTVRTSFDLRPAPTTKVEVVSQQTHFAPVLPLDTLQQVSSAIRTELASPTEQTAPAAAPSLAGSSQHNGLHPVRILTIRLDPPSLGEVTVQMRLQGDNLELKLTASQRDTSQMLQQNREVLHDLIRDSGYLPDIASVQQAGPDGSGLSGANQQGSHGRDLQDPFHRAGGEQAGQRGGHERAGAESSRQERERWARPDRHGGAPDEAARDSSGSIYL